jgi:para-nitrobenzyl esterase
VTWTCPIRRLARSAADHQAEPVYRYHFSWHAPGAGGTAIGATHGLELAFVFGNFAAFSYTPTASDLALADSIQGYWGRFAATGDPAGTPAWPRYVSATDPYLELDTTVATGTGLATAKCDALDALVD